MSALDIAARGLAVGARTSVATAAARGRLQRLMLRGEIRNPVDRPEGGAALATITPKAYASGTAGLSQAFNQATQPALFQWSGGVATFKSATTGWSAPVVTLRSAGNFSATQGALAQRFSFLTDAVSLDLITYFQPYRVLIDGQYVGKALRTDGLTSGGYNRLNIATADTTRRLRRFDIEVALATNIAGQSGGLATIYVGPNDTIAPIDRSNQIRIGVIGDSISSSTGASWAHNGYAPLLGYLLGDVDVDVRQIAIGGTGYVNDDSNPGPQQYTFLQHIADLSQTSFDLVIFAGGRNDASLVSQGNATQAQVQAAALATFQAARGLQPAAPFIVLGSFSPSTGPMAADLTTEAGIAAAVQQFADPNTAFVPVSSDPTGAWVNATNGAVINAPGAPGGGSPDGTHPGDVGHLYLARRASNAIRTAVARLAGA